VTYTAMIHISFLITPTLPFIVYFK